MIKWSPIGWKFASIQTIPLSTEQDGSSDSSQLEEMPNNVCVSLRKDSIPQATEEKKSEFTYLD